MLLKPFLVKLHWFFSSQFGLDPLRLLLSLRGVPAFVADWTRFRKNYAGKMTLMPCLHDRYEEAGTTRSEYFWQDLVVARWIHDAQPKRHVDIGSRVDGFVAHVASFRAIEVFDIRPVSASVPGVTFRQVDLMKPAGLLNYCDSLSCLHALEHFGLGRYGDSIDPSGFVTGLRNMAEILQPNGTFYLSVPIGPERVEFNANRVFDPNQILNVAASCALLLSEFVFFSAETGLINADTKPESLAAVVKRGASLGIFKFIKKS